MTREEAIAQLKMDRDLANFNPMTGEEEPMNEDCRKSVEALDMAIKALEQQPCEDTISRQAAIEAIGKYNFEFPDYMERFVTELRDAMKADLKHDIKALPSAQPERTCVNCGRTANNGGWYADGGTRCPIEEHYALPKDGFCHLWEKRSVTDDDYPERREDERPES
jgi:hypothetical protein